MELINNIKEEIAQTTFDNIPGESLVKAVIHISMLTTYNEYAAVYFMETQIKVFHLMPIIRMQGVMNCWIDCLSGCARKCIG